MKITDKFLFGIVVGILLLMVLTMVIAFVHPKADYLSESTPEAAAYNYLLALGQADYERAYSLLSPDIAGYPDSLEEFRSNIRSQSWLFHTNEVRLSQDIKVTFTFGNMAELTVRETLQRQGELLNSSDRTITFEMEMRHHKTSNQWYVLKSGSYWLNCWDQRTGCP